MGLCGTRRALCSLYGRGSNDSFLTHHNFRLARTEVANRVSTCIPERWGSRKPLCRLGTNTQCSSRPTSSPQVSTSCCLKRPIGGGRRNECMAAPAPCPSRRYHGAVQRQYGPGFLQASMLKTAGGAANQKSRQSRDHQNSSVPDQEVNRVLHVAV